MAAACPASQTPQASPLAPTLAGFSEAGPSAVFQQGKKQSPCAAGQPGAPFPSLCPVRAGREPQALSLAPQHGRLGGGFQQRSHSAPDQGAGRVWKASSSEANNRVSHRLFRQLSTSISWPETAGERSCWWLMKYNCSLAGTRETRPAGRPRQCLGRTNPSSPERCSGQNGRGTRLVSCVLLQETLAQHQRVFQRRKGSPPAANGKQGSAWEDRSLLGRARPHSPMAGCTCTPFTPPWHQRSKR